MRPSIRQNDYQKFLTMLEDADNQLARGEADMAHATLVELRVLGRLMFVRPSPPSDEPQVYEKMWKS